MVIHKYTNSMCVLHTSHMNLNIIIFRSYNNIVFYISYSISEATYTTWSIIHIHNICVFHISLII